MVSGCGDIWRKKTGYGGGLCIRDETNTWIRGMAAGFLLHMGEACGGKLWCNGLNSSNAFRGDWADAIKLISGMMIGMG